MEQWRALDGAEVKVPVLLLQAAEDPLARPEVHAELFAALDTQDKTWAVIPGGDHAAFLETPRAYFLSLIESFVFRGGGGLSARRLQASRRTQRLVLATSSIS